MIPSLFHRSLRLLVLVLPLWLAACLVTPPAKNAGPLKLSPPKMRSDQKEEREKWTAMRSADGEAFAQAKDGMDDVISMSATESPTGGNITTLDQAEATLRSNATTPPPKVRRSEVLGQPCLRYEQKVEASAAESASLRQALQAHNRTLSPPFYSRTLGAVFLHPTKPGRTVTLLCNRTSSHGEIGDYYEELFQDFLDAFVAENYLSASPYGSL